MAPNLVRTSSRICAHVHVGCEGWTTAGWDCESRGGAGPRIFLSGRTKRADRSLGRVARVLPSRVESRGIRVGVRSHLHLHLHQVLVVKPHVKLPRHPDFIHRQPEAVQVQHVHLPVLRQAPESGPDPLIPVFAVQLWISRVQLEHHRANLLRRGPVERPVVRVIVDAVAAFPAAAAAFAGAQIDRGSALPRLLLEFVKRRGHHPAIVHHRGGLSRERADARGTGGKYPAQSPPRPFRRRGKCAPRKQSHRRERTTSGRILRGCVVFCWRKENKAPDQTAPSPLHFVLTVTAASGTLNEWNSPHLMSSFHLVPRGTSSEGRFHLLQSTTEESAMHKVERPRFSQSPPRHSHTAE